MRKTNNLKLELNSKIENLTVVGCLNRKNKRGRILWLFKCECGNLVEAPASDVKLKRKTSCGCVQKKHRENCGNRLRIINTKPNKDGPLSKLFGNYKRAAEKRNYKWFLSKEQFKTLILNNCFYCGHPPSSEIFIARKKTQDNVLIYNGVDRKNNIEDYTLENCVSCCYVCNKMKMDLDYNTFINQITKINKHLQL